MRMYYIFIQEYEIMNEGKNDTGFFNPVYKLLPWQYFGFCTGTKALYNAFKYGYRRFEWVDSFEYEPDTAADRHGTFRTLVMDDACHIRNFYELTKKYQHYVKRHKTRKGYHYHYLKNMNERRQELTPEEIREFKREFDIPVPVISPDRRADAWDYERFVASGGSWKDQSRKKRQYEA